LTSKRLKFTFAVPDASAEGVFLVPGELMDTNQSEETELPQVTNLSQVSVESVKAELVRTNQTAIRQLEAEEIELNISAVGTAQTNNLSLNDSMAGIIMSEQASVEDSIVGGIRAQAISVNGITGLVTGNAITLGDGVKAGMIAGAKVEAENIYTSILLSPKVVGNVTTTVDGRTALMAGVAGGAIAGVILLVGKLLFGRKK
jgi:hypothetical protein